MRRLSVLRLFKWLVEPISNLYHSGRRLEKCPSVTDLDTCSNLQSVSAVALQCNLVEVGDEMPAMLFKMSRYSYRKSPSPVVTSLSQNTLFLSAVNASLPPALAGIILSGGICHQVFGVLAYCSIHSGNHKQANAPTFCVL